MENFQFGEEQEKEAKEGIKQTLIEIREVLKKHKEESGDTSQQRDRKPDNSK